MRVCVCVGERETELKEGGNESQSSIQETEGVREKRNNNVSKPNNGNDRHQRAAAGGVAIRAMRNEWARTAVLLSNHHTPEDRRLGVTDQTVK